METWRLFLLTSEGNLVSPFHRTVRSKSFDLFGPNYYKDFSDDSKEIGTYRKSPMPVKVPEYRKIIIDAGFASKVHLMASPSTKDHKKKNHIVLPLNKKQKTTLKPPLYNDGFWSFKSLLMLNDSSFRRRSFNFVIAKIRNSGTVIVHDTGYVQAEYIEILGLYHEGNAKLRRKISRKIGWPFGVKPIQRTKRGNGAK